MRIAKSRPQTRFFVGLLWLRPGQGSGFAFVEQLDFRTSPGHLDGSGNREALDLPGGGPRLVISDRALFDFAVDSSEMTLIEIAPGETIESIQEDVGWRLKISPELKEMNPPTSKDLHLIRTQLDPDGMYR